MGFDNTDRAMMMEYFLQNYIGRFLNQVQQRPGEIDPDHIVREALQMHSQFCSGWVKEHKKGLSPLIESCAEALVSNYVTGVLQGLASKGFTHKEISRFLRRDPVLSPQFGICLQIGRAHV